MEKKIEFKVGKETLRGKLYIPKGKGPFPGVVLFHGDKGSGVKYFEAGIDFAKKGFLTMAFNYRGHGESEGEFKDQTLNSSFEDATKAIEFLLQQKECDTNRLGVVGGSFGGYVASIINHKFNIKSLVLAMPSARGEDFTSKIDRGLIKNMDYYLYHSEWKKSKSYKNIAIYKGNLLVVRVEDDGNIPSEVVNKYYQVSKSQNKKLTVLKELNHDVTSPDMRLIYFNTIIDWFKKTL